MGLHEVKRQLGLDIHVKLCVDVKANKTTTKTKVALILFGGKKTTSVHKTRRLRSQKQTLSKSFPTICFLSIQHTSIAWSGLVSAKWVATVICKCGPTLNTQTPPPHRHPCTLPHIYYHSYTPKRHDSGKYASLLFTVLLRKLLQNKN